MLRSIDAPLTPSERLRYFFVKNPANNGVTRIGCASIDGNKNKECPDG